MMSGFLYGSWAGVWAGRMVNDVVAGVALAFVAWAALRLAGWQNSGTRFAVWFAALVGIAALPMIGTAGVSGAGAKLALPESWAVVALAMWAAVSTVLLGRVGVGLWSLRKLRRGSAAIGRAEQGMDPLFETLEKFSGGRNVVLLRSSHLRVPTAVGFFAPAVILPDWALRDLSGAELNAVVLHEVAHLRRRDDWTNLAQQVLKAVFFFHPAVWWIERKLTLEREMACDSFVLARTDNPHAYAECLVSLAEKSFLRRGLSMAQALVGRVRQTSLRVAEILSFGLTGQKTSGAGKPVLGLVAVLALASVGEITRIPQLVAFGGENHVAENAGATQVFERGSMNIAPTLASYTIPSKAKVKANGKRPMRMHSRLSKVAANVPMDEVRPVPIPAILARMEAEVVSSPVFVVLRTEHVTPTGQMFWSFRIYEFAVYHPAEALEQKIPGKQI